MNDCEVLRYDYEIVRGVECCFRDQAECDNCPYKGIENCSAILQGEVATFLESKLETIDYILEQWNNAEKEIKGLKKSNRNWRRKVQRLRKPLPASAVSMMVEQAEHQKQKAEEFIANLKAEAYKEFAERFKALLETELSWCECVDEITKPLDNLLKELVGEQPPLNDVKCKDCEYLEFELPYAVCSKAHKGIVAPDDSCGKGKLKELVGDDK